MNSFNNLKKPEEQVVRITDIKKQLGEEKFQHLAESIFCERKPLEEQVKFVCESAQLSPKAARVLISHAQDNDEIASAMVNTSGLLIFAGILIGIAGPAICWLTSFLGFVFPILFFTPILGFAGVFFGIQKFFIGILPFCRAAWFTSASILMFLLSYILIIVALVYYYAIK